MPRRTNVLVLMSDEQSWNTLGSTGNPAARTPHLDELAEHGTSFDGCYTPFPLCCPSRTSLWTAQMPRHHHVLGNWRAVRPGLREAGVAAAFRVAGYHTVYTGKWHVPGTTPARMGFLDRAAIPAVVDGRDRGRYIEPYREYARQQGYRPVEGRMENLTQADVDAFADPAAPMRATAEIPVSHWLETWQTTEFLRTMERRPHDRPWFAVCAYNAPHFPMVVPRPYDRVIDRAAVRLPRSFATGAGTRPREVRESHFARAFERLDPADWVEVTAHYLGLCALVDDQVGRILRRLRETGELDRTLVVFTSDHGDMMGAHRLMEKGHLLHYEEALKVPLLVCHPDGGAGRSDRLLSVVDVAPTLAELAGVTWDAEHDGRSFAHLLGHADGAAVRDHVVSESVLYDMDPDAHGEYRDPATWSPATDALNASVRTADRHYVYRSRDEDELYDMTTDPDQCTNLAGHPDRAGERDALRRLVAAEIEDVFPTMAGELRAGSAADTA